MDKNNVNIILISVMLYLPITSIAVKANDISGIWIFPNNAEVFMSQNGQKINGYRVILKDYHKELGFKPGDKLFFGKLLGKTFIGKILVFDYDARHKCPHNFSKFRNIQLTLSTNNKFLRGEYLPWYLYNCNPVPSCGWNKQQLTLTKKFPRILSDSNYDGIPDSFVIKSIEKESPIKLAYYYRDYNCLTTNKSEEQIKSLILSSLSNKTTNEFIKVLKIVPKKSQLSSDIMLMFTKKIQSNEPVKIAKSYSDLDNILTENIKVTLTSILISKMWENKNIGQYEKVIKILPKKNNSISYESISSLIKLLKKEPPLIVSNSYKKLYNYITEETHVNDISSIIFNKLKDAQKVELYNDVIKSLPHENTILIKKLATALIQVLINEKPVTIANSYKELYSTINEKKIMDQMSSMLIEKLLNNDSLDYYHETLEILPENNKITLIVASNYVRSIYYKIIKPAKELSATIQFLDDFPDGPGDVIQSAFTDAVELETELFVNKHDELVEKEMGLFKSLFNTPDHSPQVPDGSPENIVREKLARQLFIEAVQAKEEGKNNLFLTKYRLVTRNPFFKQTEAAFNLYRDKEIKLFFQEHFKKIEDSQREATIKLLEELSMINESIVNLNQSIDNIEYELSNTGSDSILSDEDIYRQNREFLLQSHFFNKAFGNE